MSAVSRSPQRAASAAERSSVSPRTCPNLRRWLSPHHTDEENRPMPNEMIQALKAAGNATSSSVTRLLSIAAEADTSGQAAALVELERLTRKLDKLHQRLTKATKAEKDA